MTHLSHGAPLTDYESQAAELLRGWERGDAEAVRIVRQTHPRFMDPKVPWKPRDMSDAEARAEHVDVDDARMSVARGYCFLDWASLSAFVAAATIPDGPVDRFESAVEAVVDGDTETLKSLLERDPDLVRARSTRVTNFDPHDHQATLLRSSASAFSAAESMASWVNRRAFSVIVASLSGRSPGESVVLAELIEISFRG